MIKEKDLNKFVEENISIFHRRRIDGLSNLKLLNILKRKNPYLFKAKDFLFAQDIVKALLDAHLSSQEETHFGEFLEKLAIYVNSIVYKGYKSGIKGIDLEFSKENIRYIVSIKSGPNWGNSSQIAKLRDDFRNAIKTLRTSGAQLNVIAVNGCCYGRTIKYDRGDYLKLSGQSFWSFLTGEDEFYSKIIEPIGYKAKEKNQEFIEQYSMVVNSFTKEFIKEFCFENGIINWEKLTRFNSSK
jgi:hypothetical protein